jgi:purine-nucleoside phosphorylase
MSDLARMVDETADAVRARANLEPRVGIVLGSGLSGFAEKLRRAVRIPFADLPHMPVLGVAGNPGNLIVGFVDDVPVVCLEGRAHVYEGFPAWQVVHGVRVMARLGVRAALLTNAAGAVDPSWTPGTLMVVVDHIDLMAHEPLVGLGELATTPYPDMRAAYDEALREELYAAADAENHLSARIAPGSLAIVLEDGVYAALRDPSCETPAQVKMLRTVGASVIGASTVPEMTALRQMGVRAAALSYVSHYAAGVSAESMDEEPTSRLTLVPLHRIARAWILRADRLFDTRDRT